MNACSGIGMRLPRSDVSVIRRYRCAMPSQELRRGLPALAGGVRRRARAHRARHGLQARPLGPHPHVRRRLRARDGLHRGRGDRPRRARRRDPARGTRRVRRLPRAVRRDRGVEAAGRPLADEGRGAPPDRLVEPADHRRGRDGHRPAHRRARPDRARPRRRPRWRRCTASSRSGSPRSRCSPASRRRFAASRRSSPARPIRR